MSENRFVHDGRALTDWLLQLVDDSSAKRREASRAILDRFYMPAEVIPESGSSDEEFVADFRSAVRAAVRQPDFPADLHVQKLFSISMALETLRLEEWDKQQVQDDAWHEAEAAKMGPNPSPAEVRRYLKRVCVRLRRESIELAERLPDESFETGITISYVIAALGEELLPAASLIRHMLNETHQSYIASDAIGRLGRAALEFYPDLISGLQREDANCYFSKPLGLLLRSAREKIPEVLAFVSSTNPRMRLNAIMALGHCGRETMLAFPEVERKLLDHMRNCPLDEWYAAVSSLGEVAVTSEAVSVLLDATYPATREHAPAAICSLGRIGRESHRVVPRLIQLLDEFAEPDPDWCYSGSHSRIVTALGGFGDHAHSAIPALVKRIWTVPQQYYDANGQIRERPELDQSVIRFLGECGSAAAGALPVLLEAKAEMIRRFNEERSPDNSDDMEHDDRCPEYLTVAIERVSR